MAGMKYRRADLGKRLRQHRVELMLAGAITAIALIALIASIVGSN